MLAGQSILEQPLKSSGRFRQVPAAPRVCVRHSRISVPFLPSLHFWSHFLYPFLPVRGFAPTDEL